MRNASGAAAPVNAEETAAHTLTGPVIAALTEAYPQHIRISPQARHATTAVRYAAPSHRAGAVARHTSRAKSFRPALCRPAARMFASRRILPFASGISGRVRSIAPGGESAGSNVGASVRTAILERCHTAEHSGHAIRPDAFAGNPPIANAHEGQRPASEITASVTSFASCRFIHRCSGAVAILTAKTLNVANTTCGTPFARPRLVASTITAQVSMPNSEPVGAGLLHDRGLALFSASILAVSSRIAGSGSASLLYGSKSSRSTPRGSVSSRIHTGRHSRRLTWEFPPRPPPRPPRLAQA